ncbi:protein FAR-RED ELONGATED HYPOCOTYL 3-like [Pyrus ussuriensis x Pyrus communis]|uniref:Protein FAR-RED ELONGATED HYPOCOTYL 3-like n=1 Tax=Pyrus ussuriensis x Pyrus communis TaxID=2448454 RepID=A0A5N5GFI4_9ROSA|nr:protein FAR-RED ELONGATED HYPOCOTYL 3-like [Pyrus ussuriensis x Pyrus communis]
MGEVPSMLGYALIFLFFLFLFVVNAVRFGLSFFFFFFFKSFLFFLFIRLHFFFYKMREEISSKALQGGRWRALVCQSHSELKANYIDLNERPKLKCLIKMNAQMANIYTRSTYLDIQQQLWESYSYNIELTNKNDTCSMFKVLPIDDKKDNSNVEISVDKSVLERRVILNDEASKLFCEAMDAVNEKIKPFVGGTNENVEPLATKGDVECRAKRKSIVDDVGFLEPDPVKRERKNARRGLMVTFVMGVGNMELILTKEIVQSSTIGKNTYFMKHSLSIGT